MEISEMVLEILDESYTKSTEEAEEHVQKFLDSTHFNRAEVLNPPYAMFGQGQYSALEQQIQGYAMDYLYFCP